MSYVLAHLAALGALAAAFGLGGFALERVLPSGATSLRPLACAVKGLVLWMVALFALAAVGALGEPSVVALAVLCAAAAWLARTRTKPPPEAGAWGAGFALAVLLATAPLLLRALSQDVSWDASAYHLTLPKLYLAAGGFTPVPLSVYSHWPLGTELLYAAAMSISDHATAKALHAGFGVATLWAAWLGASRFHRPASAWLAAPIVLASPVVLFEWSVAYVELAYAFFFLSGLLFVTHWRASDGRASGSLWLAGLCGGALSSIKLTGPLGAAALFCVVLPPLLRRTARGELRAAAADALRFGVPVLLLWLPWLLRAAVTTGNPVYPFAYEHFGGPDWSAALSDQLERWQLSIGMGRTLGDYLRLPLRVALDGGPTYDRFGAAIGAHWLLVVPIALAGWRQLLARTALLASAAYFVLWAAGPQQARFLIPILPPLALAGAIGALELLSRLPPTRARRARLAVFAVSLVFVLLAARRPLAQAAALLPRFAAGSHALLEAARQPVQRFVARLPPDAKLLLLNTNQGFFLERPYLADSFFEASQIADWLRGADTAEEARARLVERGVTHVLRASPGRGIEWPAGLVALLRDPELAPRRYRSGDGRFEIFELGSSP